jgi:hypothetical protein
MAGFFLVVEVYFNGMYRFCPRTSTENLNDLLNYALGAEAQPPRNDEGPGAVPGPSRNC